jgi:succinate dehydrogenase / fumarate reductase cytochrome b subunit
MHLSHGIASLFQTLGLTSLKMRPRYEFAARVIGWGLFLGFASIPTSVLLGLVKLPSALPACPMCH